MDPNFNYCEVTKATLTWTDLLLDLLGIEVPERM